MRFLSSAVVRASAKNRNSGDPHNAAGTHFMKARKASYTILAQRRGLYFDPSDCLSLARCCSQFSLLSVFSFLVACFAAELPGSTTRGRKGRNTQNSQSLSNKALFEVNAQLKLQNQGLMSLLATQQSSREHGMSSVGLQTETQPLDMVDLASVNTAWDIVKNKKEQVRDPLCQGGCVEQFGERPLPKQERRETHLSESLFRTAVQFLR